MIRTLPLAPLSVLSSTGSCRLVRGGEKQPAACTRGDSFGNTVWCSNSRDELQQIFYRRAIEEGDVQSGLLVTSSSSADVFPRCESTAGGDPADQQRHVTDGTSTG